VHETSLLNLQGKSPQTCETLVRNCLRFQTEPVAEGFLRQASERRASDLVGAVQAARLATLVAALLPRSASTSALLSRSHRELANLLRVQGKLRESAAEFEISLRHLTGIEGRAAWLEQHASLLIKTNCFGEALAELREAVGLREDEGVAHATAAALVLYAIALGDSGRSLDAVDVLSRAARLVNRWESPKLALSVGHNMAEFLLEADRPKDAIAALDMVDLLYAEVDEPLLYLKKGWMKGKIASLLGMDALALLRLRESLTGYVGRKLVYEAALVGLDLGFHHARQGRHQEAHLAIRVVLPALECLKVRGKVAIARLLQRALVAQDCAALIGKARASLHQDRAARVTV
jgi:tetratricopeptide (TPR) repeat protein